MISLDFSKLFIHTSKCLLSYFNFFLQLCANLLEHFNINSRLCYYYFSIHASFFIYYFYFWLLESMSMIFFPIPTNNTAYQCDLLFYQGPRSKFIPVLFLLVLCITNRIPGAIRCNPSRAKFNFLRLHCPNIDRRNLLL